MNALILRQLTVAVSWCLVGGGVRGQTFNTVAPNQGNTYRAVGHAVKCLPDGYLVFGIRSDQLTQVVDVSVNKFDMTGNMLWQENLNLPGEQWVPFTECAFRPGWGTGYYAAINTDRTAPDPDTVRLARFGEDGDTLWTKLVRTDSLANARAIFTDGTHIYVAGRFFDDTPQPWPDRSFITRLDSSGAILDSYRIQKIVMYTATLGESGAIYATGLGQPPFLTASDYLVKFDSTGVDQWAFMFPIPFTGSGNRVHQLSNGTVLCLGRWDDAIGPAPNGSYMLAIDPQGNFLWEYRGEFGHWDTERTMFTDCYQDTDTTFMLAGTVQRTLWSKALIYRFTVDGDSLWRREYAHFNSGMVHAPELFWDIEPTPDGGMILAGEATELANTFTQHLWLLRLDSMGCLVPGCQYVGINDLVFGLKDALQAYPSPNNGQFSLELSLPTELQVQGSLLLQVFDTQGRSLVRRELGRQLEQTIALDLSHEPAGLYSVHVSDDRRILTGSKLIVE